AAPLAVAAGDKHDDDDRMQEQRQDSGAYNATGDNGDAPPTSPDNPSGPEGSGTGSGTGTGTGGGAGTGTSGGAGSTGAGTGGAGSGGASGCRRLIAVARDEGRENPGLFLDLTKPIRKIPCIH